MASTERPAAKKSLTQSTTATKRPSAQSPSAAKKSLTQSTTATKRPSAQSPSVAKKSPVRPQPAAKSSAKRAASVSPQSDPHTIDWTVTSKGRPVQGKLVEVRDVDGKERKASARTDPRGHVVLTVPEGGTFQVWVYPNDKHGVKPKIGIVNVHSIALGSTDLPPEDVESIIDLQSYPILTEQVGFPAIPSPAVPSTPAAAPLRQIVDSALREVLGWRPKASDPKGFAAALNQAFTLKEVEGHTAWTWTPRSYTVQTDMGAVTGAQASIYTRAKVALDQSLPLLDGLYPLQSEVLPEDLESVRVVVRSELTTLVNEFGVEGGPRAPRVDQLFSLLLGDDPVKSIDPEQVEGDLQALRNRFGLARDQVNTIEDEQNYTNYLILADYVIALRQSWIGQRNYFDRSASIPYLGTQLVLLSRALEVVAQSVQNVYFAMDSVFLSPAERQTLQLNFVDQGQYLRVGRTIQVPFQRQPDGSLLSYPAAYEFPPQWLDGYQNTDGTPPDTTTVTSPLFVAELLDWVDRIASQEGPPLIQGAGKDGFRAFTSIVDKLRKFVRGAMARTDSEDGGAQDKGDDLPDGYFTPRVQRALQDLAAQLDETYKLAYPIQPPIIADEQAAIQGLLNLDNNGAILQQLKQKLGIK